MSDPSSYYSGLPNLPEEITRTQARSYMRMVLHYITQTRIPSINTQSMPLPIQQNMITAESNKIRGIYSSRSFIETLRNMEQEEFDELFKFVLDIAVKFGIRRFNAGYRTRIISDVDLQGAKIILLVFSRRKQTLTVTFFNSSDDNEIEPREYPASNNVVTNNVPGGWRVQLENGTKGKNYKPEQFPLGFWLIEYNIPGRNDLEDTEGRVLQSNAFQYVCVYKQNEKGGWDPDGQQKDWGYNIHAGGNWDSETEGCIRVHRTTTIDLGRFFDNKGPNGKMYLAVEA